MPHPEDTVMLSYRLRGEAEPQSMPVPFAMASSAMAELDELTRGVRVTAFVDIGFKLPDGRLGHVMLRGSDIVEMAWSELPANG